MPRAGRRLGLIVAAAVVLVLVAVLVLRVHSARHLEQAIEGFEAAGGSLDLASYASPALDPRDNAAHWLRTGADALVYDDDQNVLLERRVGALGQPWPAADAQAFAALLVEHDPARRLMDRAAPLERSSFHIELWRGAEAEIPDFLALLRAARLLAVECDFRQQRGELEPALAALHVLERLTAAQRAESVLIGLLAGAATERLYLDRLEAILQAVSDADGLRALRRDLDHLEGSTVPARQPFSLDTAATVSWVLSHPNEWPEWADTEATARVAQAPLHRVLPLLGLHREVAALVLEAGRRMVEEVGVPAARTRSEKEAQEVGGLHSRVPFAAELARVLIPTYRDAIRRLQWTQSAHALGRLALDLRLSRIGHGFYPRDGIELPTSAATGEPATYRILDDGAVEIAFPETEASWEEDKRSSDQRGKIRTADVNLRWRLPP